MQKIVIIFKKYKLYIVIPVLVILALLSYTFIFKKSSSTSKQQSITSTVKKGSIISTISASGQVETANYLAVTTSVNGIVKKVFVKEGDKVVSGQTLIEVTLDSEGEISKANAYAAYLRAKNSLDSAKNSLYSAQSTLIEQEDAFDAIKETNSYQTHDERSEYTIAENSYLKAKGDYEVQKSSITQQEIALNSAWEEYKSQSPVITAPSDGTIANILAVEGVQISNTISTTDRSTQTVASIKKEGTPIAQLNISEVDINSVKIGQKVSLKLNSISDKTFMGSIVGIDKIGALASGVSNYPVLVKFDADSDKVLPNMGVEAEILIEQKDNVLIVPTSAITTSRGKKTVNKSANGKPEKVDVTTGLSDSANTEILSGLNEGDQIIINSLPTSGFNTNTNTQFRGMGGFGSFGGPDRD
jgi:RND family efflux transporter MFP subunit